MPDNRGVKVNIKLGPVGGTIALILIIVVGIELYTGAESDATPQQVELIRKHVRSEQSASGFAEADKLTGEVKAKFMVAQLKRNQEIESLPLESVKVRGWGLERIARVELRFTANGPIETRYFLLKNLLGEWVVSKDALPSQYRYKVW